MQLRNPLSLVMIAPLAVAACDAGAFLDPGPVPTPVEVSVDLSAASVGGVSVEVTGPGIDPPIIATLALSDSVASGSVEVLAGSDRAFLVRAFDVQGIETHRGADTVDIAADAASTLDIALTPLTGQVGVGGQIGSYTLTVSLPSDTIAVGGSAQATVTVVDTYGDTIQSPTVTWGSSNPAVASVSTSGLVQALAAGQTAVAASYRGFGGTSVITVK